MSLRVTQVAAGVHRLSNVYTNWYLLESGGRLTVLDAGLPRDWRDFHSALSRLGYAPTDVEAVLITTIIGITPATRNGCGLRARACSRILPTRPSCGGRSV